MRHHTTDQANRQTEQRREIPFSRNPTSLQPHDILKYCGRFCRFLADSLTFGKSSPRVVTDGGLTFEKGLESGVEVDIDIDLARNRVDGRIEVSIDELFDQNGELRLWEDEDGWEGYVLEEQDGETRYFYVNTWRSEDDWTCRVRVGERCVRLAIECRVADPSIGGVGGFQRSVAP